MSLSAHAESASGATLRLGGFGFGALRFGLLYKYRERVSYDLAVKVGMIQCTLMDYSDFCGIKIENLMEDIDVTLSEHI